MCNSVGRLCRNVITYNFHQKLLYSVAVPRIKNKNGQLLITCKRKNLDHYSAVYYDKLDEVPLASKGWNHSKSKGDYFTVLPIAEEIDKMVAYSFGDLRLHSNLIDCLKKEGINKATEFQHRAIQVVQSGGHVMLAAETGCGKTLSYLLPIIQDLAENKAETVNTPKALVIVPNRELAYQVGEVAQIYSETVGVTVKVVAGGRIKSLMMNPSFEDIDLLVATPGALGKLSTFGVYKLNEVKYTVLDEADTLIDDSFIERMNGIIKRVSQSQMILVTATLPRQLPDILIPIETTLKHVVSPKIHKPLLNIKQKFIRLTKSNKASHLLEIAKNNKEPMLIFCNRSQTCNWVALFLRENGITCSNINGDMNYAIRVEQWNEFVRGGTKILSTTDVGSRGLNTVQVRQLLNYDFPLYAADYLHRIGRVGRLGSPALCKATNFVADEDEVKLVQQIELAIRRNQPLANVDGNITNMVQKKIARKIRQIM